MVASRASQAASKWSSTSTALQPARNSRDKGTKRSTSMRCSRGTDAVVAGSVTRLADGRLSVANAAFRIDGQKSFAMAVSPLARTKSRTARR